MKKLIIVLLLLAVLIPMTVYGENILIVTPEPVKEGDQVLKFDLSVIPEGISIKSANLHFYPGDYMDIANYVPFDLSLYPYVRKGPLKRYTVSIPTQTIEWYVWGITSIVQKWYTDLSKEGKTIPLDVGLWTDDVSNETLIPRLILTYEYQ